MELDQLSHLPKCCLRAVLRFETSRVQRDINTVSARMLELLVNKLSSDGQYAREPEDLLAELRTLRNELSRYPSAAKTTAPVIEGDLLGINNSACPEERCEVPADEEIQPTIRNHILASPSDSMYQHILNAAVFTEEADERERLGIFIGYSNRFAEIGWNAQRWAEYYKETIRPKYLDIMAKRAQTIGLDQPRHSIPDLKGNAEQLAEARAFLKQATKASAKRRPHSLNHSRYDSRDNVVVHSGQPQAGPTAGDCEDEDDLLVTSPSTPDAPTQSPPLETSDPDSESLHLGPSESYRSVLVTGVTDTRLSSMLAAMNDPATLGYVEYAATTGMRTSPPITTDTLLFFFRSRESATHFTESASAFFKQLQFSVLETAKLPHLSGRRIV